MTKSSVINSLAFDGLPEGTRFMEPTDTHGMIEREFTLILGHANIDVFLSAELRRFLQRTMEGIPEESSESDTVAAITERMGGFYECAQERARDLNEVQRIQKHQDRRRELLRNLMRKSTSSIA